MSLNKTLDRLFDEIRREAKRNPDFADRLDAVMRAHNSRRDVDEDTIEDVQREAPAPASTVRKPRPEASAPKEVATPSAPPAASATPTFNPVAIYQRDGEDALKSELEQQGLPALQALVAEHNLDPSGEAAELDRDALAAHILAQAKRRAERDAKLFDY